MFSIILFYIVYIWDQTDPPLRSERVLSMLANVHQIRGFSQYGCHFSHWLLLHYRYVKSQEFSS